MHALLATAIAYAAPVYQVQAVGPAGYASTATAISGSGIVVGNYRMADGSYGSYLWRDGEVTLLTSPAGGVNTWASAVNSAGDSAGRSDSGRGSGAVLWNPAGIPVPFGSGAAGIRAMNDGGDTGGMWIGADGTGRSYVTENGVFVDLGQPAAGGWSTVTALSNNGMAAGTGMDGNGQFRAFAAGPGGTTRLLPSAGSAYANAINDNGTVAGSAQNSSGYLEAAVWNRNGMDWVGTLGGTNSYAYGINGAGSLTGYSDIASGGTAAFLYYEGQLYDLNGLVTGGSGWQLTEAYGINEAGQIVGKGIYNGVEQAFLATPVIALGLDEISAAVPEPAGLLLAGAGLIVLGLIRRRR